MALQVQIWWDNELLQEIPLVQGELFIGRSHRNEIMLDNRSVSNRHAMLKFDGKSVVIEDLGSTNGTFVEETRLAKPFEITPRHKVKIGDYFLTIQEKTNGGGGGAATASGSGKPASAEKPAGEPISLSKVLAPAISSKRLEAITGNPPDLSSSSPASASNSESGKLPKPNTEITFNSNEPSAEKPFNDFQRRKREAYRQIRQKIHAELFKRLDMKRMMMSNTKDDDLSSKARKTIDEIIEVLAAEIPRSTSKGQLAKDVYDEAMGLGPLEPYLADPEITEVMVNGPDSIYVERKGKLTLTESQFLDDQQLLGIIERIVAPIGRRIDESQPMVDARLKDGSRVNAIIPPLSLKGPCVTIRKFSKTPYKVSDLIRFGSMTAEMAEFFRICVLLRKNILISGGTGSGKTTLLNVMSSFLPASDRIVTIEDAAELRLGQHHVLSLEARPPNIEGKGAVTIRDLVRNALRMRPDRIVVGECRGGEALDMLQAMNTGHDGSLTTAHANSPRDALSRLETMVLMAGMDLPVRAIREQVASAVDMIVQQDRFSDGTRKITSVTEIVGMENDIITMQELFKYVQTGVDANGTVLGYFTATGGIPTFMDEIKTRGLDLDPKVFYKKDVKDSFL